MTGSEVPHFVLLSGFLGSGKTTLLLEALRQPDLSRTGVIVNEAGEIDIDGATILSENDGLRLAKLSNGCVCCSMMTDLPMTVAALLDEVETQGLPPLDRIVLEASGLSRPGPILRQLQGMPVRFTLSTAATFDVEQGPVAARAHDEVGAQIVAAQTIVLTKTDRATPETTARALALVREMNPLATIVDDSAPGARARAALGRPDAQLFVPPFEPVGADRAAHRGIRTFHLDPGGALPIDQALEWFDNLSSFLGERLLRCKAILSIEEGPAPLLVQGVGTVFDPPRALPEHVRDRGIVVIARNVTRAELDAIPPGLRAVARA
ncbi:MAG: GTP-binding protein [Pseudomonadota bacterium]|nr:GTP-binding protein [Pseudomonadota bacterium]